MSTKKPKDISANSDPSVLENIAVCKKTQAGQVISQNEKCISICGNRQGQTCSDNCMHVHKSRNPRQTPGTNRYEYISINGKEYDILMLDDGNLLTTLLLELTEKTSVNQKFFGQFNLTKREKEIVDLLLRKKTNKSISDELCISPATLKTHINHIFKKVPAKYLKRK